MNNLTTIQTNKRIENKKSLIEASEFSKILIQINSRMSEPYIILNIQFCNIFISEIHISHKYQQKIVETIFNDKIFNFIHIVQKYIQIIP